LHPQTDPLVPKPKPPPIPVKNRKKLVAKNQKPTPQNKKKKCWGRKLHKPTTLGVDNIEKVIRGEKVVRVLPEKKKKRPPKGGKLKRFFVGCPCPATGCSKAKRFVKNTGGKGIQKKRKHPLAQKKGATPPETG